MRQLIRRLRTCEAGTGLVEYGLLIAAVALGLVGVLTLLRDSVGGLTNRTAISVSQAAGGYGTGGTVGGPPSGRPAAPDSSSAEPDSSAAAGRATAASFRLAIP